MGERPEAGRAPVGPADRHDRTRVVHVIVPEGIDDPQEPSGGNAYDRHVCLGLAAAGWTVHEHAAAGAWPQPDLDDGGHLHRTLAGLPDDAVVLIDGLVACGVPDVVVPHARRLRLVVLMHLPLGDELGRAPALAASLAGCERRTLQAAAAVVATSAWAARRVVALHGLEPARVHVASPGVDPAPPSTGTDGVSRLLCVGAVTPTKGQDLLVEALAAIALPADRRWRCDLVGPLHRAPAHVAAVRAAIGRHGLDGRVRLTGPLSGSQLAATYDDADLLVLPSRAETYGMVVTEALARGIPVLAAAVGGVPDTLSVAGEPEGPGGRMSPLIRPPEPPQASMSPLIRHRADAPQASTSPLIHHPEPPQASMSPLIRPRADGSGMPGILVAADDVAALAAALRRWFEEPELRADLRRSAARRRDTLTGWEVTSRCLEQVLDRLNRR